MENYKFFKLLVLILISWVFSCSESDDGGGGTLNLSGRESSCANANGWTGAYWDLANAIPVPLNGVLTIPNEGAFFQHQFDPRIGFRIPSNYTASEITIPQFQALGVDVVRNDGQAYFRWIPTSFIPQGVPSETVLANEINTFLNFYNFNGVLDEADCSQTRSQLIAGIGMEFNARLLRFDDRILQVYVITTYAAGGTYMTISVVTAPEAEYETEVVNTFWPINFQLYVDDRGNIVDQDGDGFTLLEDPDDTDPNVPVNQG